jgi:flagella basal body P-ring formation protein FlgA
MFRQVTTAVCLLALAELSTAGEIVLRSQAAPRGPVVRLGDVAEIKGEAGQSTEELAAMPLMPAPTSGGSQFLRGSQLRDLLAAREMSLNGWRITGAEAVEIKSLPSRASTSGSKPEVTSAPKSDADHLTDLVTDYLRQQTGHDLWSVNVDADDDVLIALQRAGAEATLNGGKAPWAGRQRFVLSGAAAEKPAYIYARIERLEMVSFAVRAIERGELVRRSDVEVRPFGGALPTQAVLSPEAIVGKEAVQAIRPDSILVTTYVRSPIIVRRGERVGVRARAAGVVVRTFAIAQQEGGLGDLVMVQAVDGKDRYAARVSGVRELEVFAAQPTVTEVASSPQAATR